MAYDFNGTNQYLSCASASVTATPITIACWFYVTNTTAAHNLVGLNSANAVDRYALQARGDVAGDPVRAQVNISGTSANADTTAAYSANTWTHACGVFLSSTSRTAYINGGSSGTNTTSVSPSGINQQSIGAQRFLNNSNGASFTSGRIAEVGIYNVELTAAEILSLARGFTCDKVRPQSLVFYAPLVRDLIDYKGGLTITNNNTATVANHPRVYA